MDKEPEQGTKEQGGPNSSRKVTGLGQSSMNSQRQIRASASSKAQEPGRSEAQEPSRSEAYEPSRITRAKDHSMPSWNRYESIKHALEPSRSLRAKDHLTPSWNPYISSSKVRSTSRTQAFLKPLLSLSPPPIQASLSRPASFTPEVLDETKGCFVFWGRFTSRGDGSPTSRRLLEHNRAEPSGTQRSRVKLSPIG